MARVTQNTSSPSDTDWQEDHWYRVRLRGVEIEAKGTPGYKGQPRKHARMTLTWELPGTDDWIFDLVDCTVSLQQDKTASKGLLLICALADRDWRHERTPWLENETLEYGFGPDTNNDVPAGRIVAGIEVAVKGDVIVDANGFNRLRIKRYGPASQGAANAAAAAPRDHPDTKLSPDGRWRWNGATWEPVNDAPPPPPPPAPAPTAAAVQTELI